MNQPNLLHETWVFVFGGGRMRSVGGFHSVADGFCFPSPPLHEPKRNQQPPTNQPSPFCIESGTEAANHSSQPCQPSPPRQPGPTKKNKKIQNPKQTKNHKKPKNQKTPKTKKTKKKPKSPQPFQRRVLYLAVGFCLFSWNVGAALDFGPLRGGG